MNRLFPLVLLAAFAAVPALAQNLEWAEPSVPSESVAPPIDAGVPGLPDAPAAVPIDGGLVFLAVAGAGYAVRRLRKRQPEA